MIGHSELQLPESVQTSRPWRIKEILGDFKLQDAWALPTPGGPDDFPKFLEQMTASDPSKFSSTPTRVLFAIRWKIGELLGWDDRGRPRRQGAEPPRPPPRRPPGRTAAAEGEFDALPFESIYLTDDEWAGEIANRTVHGVMHLGWVADPEMEGGYRGEMAVYVKSNGMFGSLYMAAIDPFRHYVVYPPMLKEMGRRWKRSKPRPEPART